MEFECHECGHDKFEEVMRDCVVQSECHMDEDGNLHYGEQDIVSGDVCHYQCVACGERIRLFVGVDNDGFPQYDDVESAYELRMYFGHKEREDVY